MTAKQSFKKVSETGHILRNWNQYNNNLSKRFKVQLIKVLIFYEVTRIKIHLAAHTQMIKLYNFFNI
jgi:hypothetical protein